MAGRDSLFYNANSLVSITQGQQHMRILRASDVPLTQARGATTTAVTLLASDASHSISATRQNANPHAISYSPYGYCPVSELPVVLGFNGERHDLSGVYLLGNGNRAYSPALMRFLSPDRVGIFIPGNYHAYGYAVGDPVNLIDPSGNLPVRKAVQRHKSEGSIQKNSGKTKHPTAIFTVEVEVRAKFGRYKPDSQIIDENSARWKIDIDNNKKRISDLNAMVEFHEGRFKEFAGKISRETDQTIIDQLNFEKNANWTAAYLMSQEAADLQTLTNKLEENFQKVYRTDSSQVMSRKRYSIIRMVANIRLA